MLDFDDAPPRSRSTPSVVKSKQTGPTRKTRTPSQEDSTSTRVKFAKELIQALARDNIKNKMRVMPAGGMGFDTFKENIKTDIPALRAAHSNIM